MLLEMGMFVILMTRRRSRRSSRIIRRWCVLRVMRSWS
jgi:hypothetical protein